MITNFQKLLHFLFIIMLAQAWVNEPNCGQMHRRTLIVEGDDARQDEYPWMVGIRSIYSDHVFCGGSIISKNMILTAAHCLNRYHTPDRFDVVTAQNQRLSNEIQLHAVASFIVHPQFNMNMEHDLALIVLEEDIQFDLYRQPVCLPENFNLPFGEWVTVTGWGMLDWDMQEPEKLQEAQLTLYNPEYCKIFYGKAFTDNQMMCAGLFKYTGDSEDTSKDSCQGDSGGPLVYLDKGRYVQIGIVSWGFACGNALAPGIYTYVANNLDFVDSYVASFQHEKPGLNAEDTDPCPQNCIEKAEDWIGDQFCDTRCIGCEMYYEHELFDNGDCSGNQHEQAVRYLEGSKSEKSQDAWAILVHHSENDCLCPESWENNGKCDADCVGCNSWWTEENGEFNGGDCGQPKNICEACFQAEGQFSIGECGTSSYVGEDWFYATDVNECETATKEVDVMLQCMEASTNCETCMGAGPTCQWSSKANVCVSKALIAPDDLTQTCR